ncbi:hypothetical protein N2152v2_000948 [Parachlorella kessleri]
MEGQGAAGSLWQEQDVPEIRKLEESVVNRIAAGEVIQRPASALKEMLENSLDAGSTQITVTVKEGGIRMLQIQDNGHGIRREDLPILCERFTTSKLRSFEDLQGIQTLGFRGEALASISYVAHMTVTTMTADSHVAYRATYSDSIMGEGCPKPCASTKGTIILVEDLFYNVPLRRKSLSAAGILVEDLFYNVLLRRKALKSASEEYNHILDVVGRYAVYKAGVALTCKRQGEARADLHTLQGGSRLDAIRAVYGASVARNVAPLSLKQTPQASEGAEGVSFEVEGFVSGADYSGKKTLMVLFINGRAVDCTPLKRALESTYAAILPKAAKPFIFLDVRLPGSHVDVNVHPTKREVGFLHQEELIEAIRSGVEERLLTGNNRRTYTQTQLPGAPLLEVPTNTQQPAYYRPDKLVRTDARAQTLHAFLPAAAAPPATAAQRQQAQQELQGVAERAQQAEQDLHGVAAKEGGPSGMDLDTTSLAGEEPDGGGAIPQQHQQQPSLKQYPQGQADGVGVASLPLPLATATAAAAAAAAAAAVPAARRRRGTGSAVGLLAGEGGGSGSGAFDFMPTPMEIAGAATTGQESPAGAGMDALAQSREAEDGTGREPSGQWLEGGSGAAAAAGVAADGSSRKRAAGGGLVRHRSNPSAASGLASVQALLAEAERSPHPGLTEILKSPTWVGMADDELALVQHGTRLYLLNIQALSHDMFYQQALRRVGHCRRIRLAPALSIAELALTELEALEAAGKWQSYLGLGLKSGRGAELVLIKRKEDSDANGTKEEVASLLTELLHKKAGWLAQHFSMDIDAEGRLCSLPQLIEQYTPDLLRLPAFVLALAQRVEWGDEAECFRTLALALADLYSVQPLVPYASPASVGAPADTTGSAPAEGGMQGHTGQEPPQQAQQQGAQQGQQAQQQQLEEESRAREWSIQHVLLPALRLFLRPGRSRASDGTVLELTHLETLYKVFERC